MEFSIKDFSSKCDQICSFLRIWSHLLEKPLMKNLIFCAVSIGTTFSAKFVLDAKVQNSASWNVSIFGICGTSLSLNMSLKSEWIFWNTKIYRNGKKWKYISSDSIGQNIVDKPTKLSNVGFSMEYFTAGFLQIYNATVKITLLVGQPVTFPLVPSISKISLKFLKFLRL